MVGRARLEWIEMRFETEKGGNLWVNVTCLRGVLYLVSNIYGI
jgi:hypothetical protein